jgi:hypothetical protein
LIQYVLHVLGGRLLFEGQRAHDATREMIFDNRGPVAERPALRQSEGKPTGPEAAGEDNKASETTEEPIKHPVL